jgi:hypothetical protein
MLLLRQSLRRTLKVSPSKGTTQKQRKLHATIKIKLRLSSSVLHIKGSSQPISEMHKRRVHLQSWTRRNSYIIPHRFPLCASNAARLCFCMISIPRAIVGFIKGISSVHPCSFIPFISLQCSPFRRLSTAVGPLGTCARHTHMEWATQRQCGMAGGRDKR